MTAPDHPDTAEVYLVNATSCSAGTGPGCATLPWNEGKAIMDRGLAVYGRQPPPNFGQGSRPVTPR